MVDSRTRTLEVGSPRFIGVARIIVLPNNRVALFTPSVEMAEAGTGNLPDPQNPDSVTYAELARALHQKTPNWPPSY